MQCKYYKWMLIRQLNVNGLNKSRNQVPSMTAVLIKFYDMLCACTSGLEWGKVGVVVQQDGGSNLA